MVDHQVQNGSIGCGKSAVEGTYLLRCTDADSQTKMVLTEAQVRELVERLKGMLPVLSTELVALTDRLREARKVDPEDMTI